MRPTPAWLTLQYTLTDRCGILFLALAHDLEFDLGVLRPAHFLDRLVEREPLHRLVGEVRADVVGHDARLRGPRLVDGGGDLDQGILHGHLHAAPAGLAAGPHLYVAAAL